ncbi:MAG: RecT family recombinase [Gallionella sp.]|jgi:phage recombination protein Bet
MTNEIATRADNDVALTKEDVYKFFDKERKCTEAEILLFLKIAQVNKLNVWNRELHLIKYGNSPATIVLSYEVYLRRAEASKQWGGDKCWTEGSVENGDLKACIEVYRKDWERPMYHEVLFKEYARDTQIWKTKPITMIKKVATAQAYRRAFPNELAGLPYIADEIGIEERREEYKPEFEMPKEEVRTVEQDIDDLPPIDIEIEAPLEEAVTVTPSTKEALEERVKAIGAKVSGRTITEKQKNLLFAKSKEYKIDNQTMKDAILGMFKKEHSADLTSPELDQLLKWMQEYSKAL